MRQGLKTALTFTAGVAVGALAAGSLGVAAIFKIQAMREGAMAHESAFNAQMLSTPERTHMLREMIFEGLPYEAQHFDARRDELEFASALWSIRLAYSMNDRPVPQEIEQILSNLPSEAAPRCPMPRRKLGLPPLPAQEAPRPGATNNAQL